MPEKSIPPPPPELLLALVAAVLGVIAQLGVNLALGVAQKKRVLAGLLILSGLLSGGGTLLLVRLTSIDPYAAATICALIGAAPPLLVLRAGLQAAAKRAGLSLHDLLGVTPAGQAGWVTYQSPQRKEEPPHE